MGKIRPTDKSAPPHSHQIANSPSYSPLTDTVLCTNHKCTIQKFPVTGDPRWSTLEWVLKNAAQSWEISLIADTKSDKYLLSINSLYDLIDLFKVKSKELYIDTTGFPMDKSDDFYFEEISLFASKYNNVLIWQLTDT